VTLHGLRRALGPELARPAESDVIVTDGDAYRVVLSESDSWDAQEFLEAAQSAAQVGDPAARLAALQATRSRYTGPLFPEWAYEEWAQARRAQVEHARVNVLELLAEALTDAGRLQAAVAAYRDLLVLEPEREAWPRSLMRAYALAGEQALALRQFHACRTVLRDEMGVEPSAETRELYQRILTEQPLESLPGPIPQGPPAGRR
jgi:DNA-binding SARP family transcriptional activator